MMMTKHKFILVGMGSVASSGGRSSPLGFSERLSLASGSIGSGGGDAAPLSPQQLGVMGKIPFIFSKICRLDSWQSPRSP